MNNMNFMKHKNLLYSFLVIIILLTIAFMITRGFKMENNYNDAEAPGEIQQKYLKYEDHNIYYEIQETDRDEFEQIWATLGECHKIFETIGELGIDLEKAHRGTIER